jgi:hypothetical protein
MTTTTTPLLVLLDGVLAQDEERTSWATEEINKACHGRLLPQASPIQSRPSLIAAVEYALRYQPLWATTPSEHDGSYPLHFASSLGNVQVASIILRAVSPLCDS